MIRTYKPIGDFIKVKYISEVVFEIVEFPDNIYFISRFEIGDKVLIYRHTIADYRDEDGYRIPEFHFIKADQIVAIITETEEDVPTT